MAKVNYIEHTRNLFFSRIFSPKFWVLHFPVSHFLTLHFWPRLCRKF